MKVVTKGTPAAYCYVETATADPKKVTITGPESVLSQIATVEAIVDVSGVGEDMATNSKVVLLDEAGNEISQDRLTLNRTSVAVDVKITMGKSVPLKFTTNGTPADGYRYEKAECSVSSVKLVGSSEALAGISENLRVTDEYCGGDIRCDCRCRLDEIPAGWSGTGIRSTKTDQCDTGYRRKNGKGFCRSGEEYHSEESTVKSLHAI